MLLQAAHCTPAAADPSSPTRLASHAAWLAQEQCLVWGLTSAQRRVLAALTDLKVRGAAACSLSLLQAVWLMLPGRTSLGH